MWDIVGQEKAVSFLQKSLAGERLAHAYLASWSSACREDGNGHQTCASHQL